MVFLLTFLIMSLIVAGMAVGVMAGREPLKGSCGGLSAVGIDGRCDICGGDPNRCENPENPDAEPHSEAEFYDAARRD